MLPTSSFTPRERDLIRREFCPHFGQDPSIANGIFLRTWRGGERQGEPKIPAAVQSMLERGLVEIRPAHLGARVFFTAAGLQELRALLQNRRAVEPERFAHLRRELASMPGKNRWLRIERTRGDAREQTEAERTARRAKTLPERVSPDPVPTTSARTIGGSRPTETGTRRAEPA
jgi:hypothetical protein